MTGTCKHGRWGRMVGLALWALGGLAVCGSPAVAETIKVRQFSPVPGSPVADQWYFTDVRNGGTASIVNLTGLGGNLENNQPLPVSAAQLTTGFSNGDKAEVGTLGDFGSAATVLQNLQMSYSYYKQTVAGGNAFAAPSLKLTVFAPGGTGDNFGQLIFEPSWNLGAGSQPVPADSWQAVNIAANTGSGDDTTGGWWWSGGFEVPSGAGGPPIKSAAEWAALFNTSDPNDFANARIVGISVGVGTFNPGQVGYFDAVHFAVPGGRDVTYDFELQQEVPEPGTLAAWALLGLGTAGARWWKRRKRSA